jgi:ssDNA-binding Zn-finger/Zn-ribbon topoisomerase 1
MIAELRVYLRAPGAVARCPTCGKVMLVIVGIRGTERFYASSMELMSRP